MRFLPWRDDFWFSKEGSFLPFDKLEHLILGIVGGYLMTLFYGWGSALFIGSLVAVGWEFRDSFSNWWSWKDLISGIGGLIIGIMIALF